MSQNPYPSYQQSDITNRKNAPSAAVTTDSTQWAQKTKFRWIFWLAVLLSAAVVFASCKNSGSADSEMNASDTAGLAAFNAQKAADSVAALQKGDAAETQGTGDGQVSGTRASYAGNAGSEESGAVKSINDDNSGSVTDDNSAGATASAADQTSSDEAAAATTTKKKKFSNAAKGALIGAGSGAVVGALVTKKNRGLGAVIGAAVGGGAGYGIGKHKDNKAKESE